MGAFRLADDRGQLGHKVEELQPVVARELVHRNAPILASEQPDRVAHTLEPTVAQLVTSAVQVGGCQFAHGKARLWLSPHKGQITRLLQSGPQADQSFL